MTMNKLFSAVSTDDLFLSTKLVLQACQSFQL